MLSFADARRTVVEATGALGRDLSPETIELAQSCGRVLAQTITADRDYPPFDRAMRDGFAVRAADTTQPGTTLRIVGEIRAGSGFDRAIGAGECAQIMTGAAVPAGADAVVMIEQTRAAGGSVTLERGTERGQNIARRGIESLAGEKLLDAGTRLGYPEMALAAQVGCARVAVFAKPRVAILSTGDEVVGIGTVPGPFEIRNANGLALETLVRLAGGEAVSLGNARDAKDDLRPRIERGLECDALVISGGVSAGKYDLVEDVLAEFGAKIIFDAVAIRPGKPTVFAECRGKPVFGLPGNPVSTMVTFEVFVAPPLDILSGTAPGALPLVRARLTHNVRERAALTHFLPARVDASNGEPEVSVVKWQGSGDVGAVAHANAFLVVPAERLEWAAGEWAAVLPRRGPGGIV
jgi:molybdopterin molybdotransferase